MDKNNDDFKSKQNQREKTEDGNQESSESSSTGVQNDNLDNCRSCPNIFVDVTCDNVITAVLVVKPTEDSTATAAEAKVKNVSDGVDGACIVTVENPSNPLAETNIKYLGKLKSKVKSELVTPVQPSVQPSPGGSEVEEKKTFCDLCRYCMAVIIVGLIGLIYVGLRVGLKIGLKVGLHKLWNLFAASVRK